MEEHDTDKTGSIVWVDLTVPDAQSLRDYYQAVLGWDSQPVDMGGYDDYNMLPAPGVEPVAGVCHARSVNADLPPVWMVYFQVADLAESVERALALGGEILADRRGEDGKGFVVLRDPAGAVSALIG